MMRAAVFSFLLALLPSLVCAKPALRFELAGEEKTIGDIKPSFIVYKEKELPDVSVEYVMRRYIKLFENSGSPDVKIDALNRINNLSAKYGISSKKLTIDTVKQSQVLLESYKNIVDSGIFYERMDELLYQTGKATTFTGNAQDAIKRLKLLVGLYPNSPLVDESMFRIAEAHFALGEYAKAEAQYKKLLAFGVSKEFYTKASFKLAWAVFRQDRYDEADKHAFSVLSNFETLAGATDLSSLDLEDLDLAEDVLRLLAIQFSKQDSEKSIVATQTAQKTEAYAFLLHDALLGLYLAQDRFEEAAKVASHYASAYSNKFEAYTMALNSIKSYQKGEFDIQAWNSKQDFVANFGIQSHYWSQLSEQQKSTVRPHLQRYGEELAHLYYVRMEQNRGKAEHRKFALRSVEYHMMLTQLSPLNDSNGEFIFLAAEALRDVGEFKRAIALYERAGFDEPKHKLTQRSAYAAVLTYDEWSNANQTLPPAMIAGKRANILRYADRLPSDKETPELLAFLANEYFKEDAFEKAAETSTRVLLPELASAGTRYASLLVRAHSLYALSQFALAERDYAQGLEDPLTSKRDLKEDLSERLALSIFRQAEQENDPARSAELYLKLVDVAPLTSLVPQALFNASTKQLELAQYSSAIASLSYLQAGFPKHALYNDATETMIYAYEQNGDWLEAADKLSAWSLVNQTSNPDVAANALFQSAEYYEKSGMGVQATESYQRFVDAYSDQFELSIEARDRIARHYKANDAGRYEKALAELVAFEGQNKARRTVRSANLAASAAFTLTKPLIARFEKTKLTGSLKSALRKKKVLLDEVVESMQALADYGIQEWQSAAVHETASLYRVLARDLLSSERPAGLSELELEQYDILLEEQAYPFEEKALEVYAINRDKVRDDQYDEWIAKSFEALAEMNPTVYRRTVMEPEYAAPWF